jgi:thioredoxin-like negative regulator of GroEL
MTEQLNSLEAFERFINASPIAAVYFSGPDCNVCEVLKPKVMDMFVQRFPAIALAEVDCGIQTALAAQQSVFAVPTLIVYIEGRESIRKARSFSPAAVAAELARPYSILAELLNT